MSELTPRDTTGYAVKVFEKLFKNSFTHHYANSTDVKVKADGYDFSISMEYDAGEDKRYIKLVYGKYDAPQYYLEEWEDLVSGWDEFHEKTLARYNKVKQERETANHEALLKKLR